MTGRNLLLGKASRGVTEIPAREIDGRSTRVIDFYKALGSREDLVDEEARV